MNAGAVILPAVDVGRKTCYDDSSNTYRSCPSFFLLKTDDDRRSDVNVGERNRGGGRGVEGQYIRGRGNDLSCIHLVDMLGSSIPFFLQFFALAFAEGAWLGVEDSVGSCCVRKSYHGGHGRSQRPFEMSFCARRCWCWLARSAACLYGACLPHKLDGRCEGCRLGFGLPCGSVVSFDQELDDIPNTS